MEKRRINESHEVQRYFVLKTVFVLATAIQLAGKGNPMRQQRLSNASAKACQHIGEPLLTHWRALAETSGI